MLVMFLFVPRIAPIWSLDLGESRAKTGLSDKVSVGDIASLSQSDELAFRAVFSGDSPIKSQLYWRALVLDQYDGSAWSRGSYAMDRPPMVSFNGKGRGWHEQVITTGSEVDYQIIMEPTDQPWLFSLDAVTGFPAKVGYSIDHRLVSDEPVSQPKIYDLQSSFTYQMDAQIPQWLRDKNLQLPKDGDLQSRALANALWGNSQSVEGYIQQVLNYFATEEFEYTLKPGQLLDVDKVDQFLFERKRGFCSHYAGAFVYLMRSAGIPARMVAGYQGGEYNQLGNYWLIHQFDAHAWAEVWIAGQGWKRVDPTAIVSSARIESGIEQAVSAEQSFLADSPLSPARYRDWAWVTQLRYSMDYINYAWYRNVLGYDAQAQLAFLSRWLGEVDLKRLAFWLLGSVLCIVLLLAVWVLGRSGTVPADPLLKEYLRFCRKLERHGLRRNEGESPTAFARRAAHQLPEKKNDLLKITDVFERYYYGGAVSKSATKTASVAVLRQLVSRL